MANMWPRKQMSWILSGSDCQFLVIWAMDSLSNRSSEHFLCERDGADTKVVKKNCMRKLRKFYWWKCVSIILPNRFSLIHYLIYTHLWRRFWTQSRASQQQYYCIHICMSTEHCTYITNIKIILGPVTPVGVLAELSKLNVVWRTHILCVRVLVLCLWEIFRRPFFAVLISMAVFRHSSVDE